MCAKIVNSAGEKQSTTSDKLAVVFFSRHSLARRQPRGFHPEN